MLVTRFLGGPERADHYFYLVSVLVFAGLLSNQGIPMAATKRLAETPEENRSRLLGVTFRLTSLYTASSLVALAAFALLARGRHDLRADLPALGLCVLFLGPAKWISGALQGLGRLRAAGAYESALEMLRLAALGAALSRGGDAGLVFKGWALAGALHLGLGVFLLRATARDFSPWSVARAEGAGDVALLAFSLFLPFIGLFIISNFFTILLAEFGAPGEASQWSLGLQLSSALVLVSAPLGASLLPHLSRGAARDGTARLFEAARPILLRAAAALIAAALLLILFAEPIMRLLFTSGFSGASHRTRLLCLFFLPEAGKFFLDPVLITLGGWKSLAKIEAVRLILVIALGPFAVRHASLDGALLVFGAAVLVSAVGKAGLYLSLRRKAAPAAGWGSNAVR